MPKCHRCLPGKLATSSIRKWICFIGTAERLGGTLEFNLVFRIQRFIDRSTLSRLNRCHPQKHDTFVLDFFNNPVMIEQAFSRYYRTTLLSGETDPNKLYDLIATMEDYQVYSEDHVQKLVDLYLNGAARQSPSGTYLLRRECDKGQT